MKTSNTKPSKYFHRKPLAEDVAFNDGERVPSQSLKNLYKNVKRSPE